MRAVPALLVLVAGCIAAEPGKETESTSQRKACTELEGRTFQGTDGQSVVFVADDAEYSMYTETTNGTPSTGIAQCISANGITNVYLDGAIDHYSARADVRYLDTTVDTYLRWTSGQLLTAH